jgi:hypothetical protein
MSLEFYRIMGKTPRTDAVSVVQGQKVIDIVPVSDLKEKGITKDSLAEAFLYAAEQTATGSVKALRARARLSLGLGY